MTAPRGGAARPDPAEQLVAQLAMLLLELKTNLTQVTDLSRQLRQQQAELAREWTALRSERAELRQERAERERRVLDRSHVENHAAVGPMTGSPALSATEERVVRALLARGNERSSAKQLAQATGERADARFYGLLHNLSLRRPPVLESNHTGYVVVGILAAGLPPPDG